ncbi:hypothetical protein [Streptomyces sp. Inha503]|uniref:hypothetical protein n=1 Tax=Streptomyces sp. Inha503 TaxID=3383314 RepID=UPI0039A01C02
MLNELSPAGLLSARDTLVELVMGVLRQKVDGTEPQLASPLVQAAKDMVNRHLDHFELSPSMLARELNVSVRTLHRAFAVTNESDRRPVSSKCHPHISGDVRVTAAQ